MGVGLADYGENVSYRGAFAIMCGLLVLGGAIVLSAGRFIAADVERLRDHDAQPSRD